MREEDRFFHDVDKTVCQKNHAEFTFGTRVLWLFLAAFYRSIKPLLDIREKALRNLSRICPNGYHDVENINPSHIVRVPSFSDDQDEARLYISIELQTMAYLGNSGNVSRWLDATAFFCDYVQKLASNAIQPTDVVNYLPYSLIDTILAMMSIFNQCVARPAAL